MSASYYAIIPADVRYDKKLNANAKLLYGEITALCNEKGYCWASNKYFADLYSASERTIQRWIKNLIDKKYITADYIYKENSKEIEQRKLIICGDKSVATSRQECRTPHDKNVVDNTTVFNNTNNNIFLSDSNEYRLADYLRKYILKNNPTAKVPNDDGIQKWCKTMDLMLRRDKRTAEDIKEHIHFSQIDTFWSTNILSPTSLRKQYDQLTMKMKPVNKNNNSNLNNEDTKARANAGAYKMI